jgi:hypothetical protein
MEISIAGWGLLRHPPLQRLGHGDIRAVCFVRQRVGSFRIPFGRQTVAKLRGRSAALAYSATLAGYLIAEGLPAVTVPVRAAEAGQVVVN